MAAQNKLFQRLIWLADTVYSAKHITMDEIDSRWSKSPYNDAHESRYGKRHFSRHKETIAELFSIEIVCDRSTNTALPAEPTAQNKNYNYLYHENTSRH